MHDHEDLHEAARQDIIDGFAARLIYRSARQLIGRAGYGPSDVEDLQQELRRRLLERLPSFDPERGNWESFAVVVIKSRMQHLLNAGRAACRFPLAVSLDGQDRHDRDRQANPNHASPAEHDRRRSDRRTEIERLQLRLDIEVVINRLDPRDREICRRQADESASELARRLGMPRTTLNDRRRRLRNEFRDLKDF